MGLDVDVGGTVKEIIEQAVDGLHSLESAI